MVALDLSKELEKTLHIQSGDIPYILAGPGMEMRILHARVEDDYFVTQLRASPGAVSGLHKHPFNKGAAGFTLRGRWGHDHQYLYGPGTYVFETPGVVHRFLNGPEETEVIFFGNFALEYVDPETLNVTDSLTAESILKIYRESCESRGFVPAYLH